MCTDPLTIPRSLGAFWITCLDFYVHSWTEQSSPFTGSVLHYDKRTSPADLSTLQRNSCLTFRSLSTESTFAVSSTSVFLRPVLPWRIPFTLYWRDQTPVIPV
ncbi:hypothetical protein GOODEAATRI_031220 [Goodea atripinnis]|uniref:Uncharacterized protein n=1 Tax=Goodea atripinnis TaxID=208336 RepID=A0ABV0MMA3_9TELE